MKPYPISLAALLFAITGCATVETRVVPLTGASVQPAAPSRHVDVLMTKPQKPYRELARLETRGRIGVSEQELLTELREQAGRLGADAVLTVESQQTWHPPIDVRDTWYDKRFSEFPFHGWGPFSPWGWGPFGPDPAFRTLGGGYSRIVRSVALQYLKDASPR